MSTPIIEQLTVWANELEASRAASTPEVVGIIAGLREVAADLQRDAEDEAGYASLSWCAADVRTLRHDLSDEQAEAFLDRNERWLRDRLTEVGWEVMQTLMDTDDELPPLAYGDEPLTTVIAGQRVYWLDPGDGLASGPGVVNAATFEHADGTADLEPIDANSIILLNLDDGGEAEVYLHELRAIKEDKS